ncbi:MAG: 23S rRNA (adenine(2503)-C(2))-methyltransferase RlmN [Clostridia bacterium]
MSKIDILSLTLSELTEKFKELNIQSYKALQVFQWLSKGEKSFENMTNLSKNHIEMLNQIFFIENLKISKKLESKLDSTVKYLFRLSDNEQIETVVMEYHHGFSICISSQVGCRMGCKFCASTIGGLVRNLTAGEMFDQILAVKKDLGITIASVVIMGIGEPLDNFDNLISFLYNISNKDGFNLSLRHLSLSTSGIVPNIEKLSKYKFPLTLSVSLHAPNNKLRDSIMPINSAYPIEKLIAACKEYFKVTGRRISFEYTLIENENDNIETAIELAKLLKGINCHVNLIPVNTVLETGFKRSSRTNVELFMNKLLDYSITATVRRTLGKDINASCGQLRNEKAEEISSKLEEK